MSEQAKASLDDALAIMRDLRARDPWDAAQTHDSLRPYLNEESHELDEALRDEDDDAMKSELGDVLLQVLFHAVIAEERGAFDITDVAGSLVHKMTVRHPQLYGDASEREPWEQMKAKTRKSIAEGLPLGLPALHRAHRLQERAAGVGFDWPDPSGPAQKVTEELAEVEQVLDETGHRFTTYGVPSADPQHEKLEGELGDLARVGPRQREVPAAVRGGRNDGGGPQDRCADRRSHRARRPLGRGEGRRAGRVVSAACYRARNARSAATVTASSSLRSTSARARTSRPTFMSTRVVIPAK